jgi:hypothetical protein
MVYGFRSKQPFRRIVGTDLWHLVRAPRALAGRVQARGDRERARRCGSRIRSTRTRRRVRSGPTRSAHGAGLQVPEWTQETRTPRARPHAAREPDPERGARTGRASRIYRPGAPPADAAIPRSSSCTTAATTCDYASHPDGARQSASTARDGPRRSWRSPLPRAAARVRSTPDIAAFVTEELSPVLDPSSRSRTTPKARCLMGARSAGWPPAHGWRIPDVR